MSEYERLRLAIDYGRLDSVLEQMVVKMMAKYHVAPLEEWCAVDEDAMTSSGICPSINYHRRFENSYEVVFFTASGEVKVFKADGPFLSHVERYITGYK